MSDTIRAMQRRCPNRLLNRATRAPIAMVLAIWMLQACASQQSATLDSAIRHYEAARYKQAYDSAWLARRSASGVARQEAAYVAGLSALKMDRPVTARDLLEEAAESTDRQLSGSSNVSLATLLLEDGEPLAAARAFDKAAECLTGSDAIKARRAAAAAYRTAGRPDIAQARLEGTPAPSSIGIGRFTIQGGAFHDRARATARARELSDAARRTSLGTARVIPAEVKGRAGFLVQIGSYDTRSDAESIRRMLGISGTFVARVDA